MTELSSSAASRVLWSKTHQKSKLGGRPQRREPGVVLPLLSQRSRDRQTSSYDILDNITRGTSLKALLAPQLDGDDREPYSRSQLRAMASSKLQSSNNNNNSSSHSRLPHKLTVKTEAGDRLALAPLVPASLTQVKGQRQSLPESLQAAIDEVLAVRTTDSQFSDRDNSYSDSGNNNHDEDCTPELPSNKDLSTCKVYLSSQRPEWRRYIRRIMMTRSFGGTTLARYRRLVGIVARKNLAKSFAGAAERVVQYRLEFRSAVVVQKTVLGFLKRRRQAKVLEQHKAALTIQHVWAKVIERKQRQKLEEEAQQAEIVRLACLGAASTIQKAYRGYRFTCHLRQEQLRKQYEASVLQASRLKLLNKYHSWRQRSKSVVPNQEPTCNSSNAVSSAEDNVTRGEFTIPHELHEPTEICATPVSDLVEAVPCSSIIECTELVGIEAPCGPAKLIFAEPDCNIDLPVASITHSSIDPVSFDGAGVVAQQSDQDFQKSADVVSVASYDVNQSYSAVANMSDLTVQEHDNYLKTCLPACDDKATSSPSTSMAKTVPEDDSSSSNDNADARELDVNQTLSDDNGPQKPDDSQETQAREAITKAAATIISHVLLLNVEAKRIARVQAAQKIARILLRTAKARRTTRMHASILIQCCVRSYQAKQHLVQRRLDALQSLRAQLHASWNPSANQSPTLLVENTGAGLESGDEKEEEDSNFEFEGPASIQSVPDSYLHLLPTRNGQVPPGVPLLKCNGGAPILPLWKWSWPKERWISSDQ